jgi:hypothetical protein
MGRRKKDGNHSPPENNLIQDLEENEENWYPVPDSNITNINDTKEPNDVHKKHPQRRNPASNHWEFHEDDTRHS